jgi:hypothetical protein
MDYNVSEFKTTIFRKRSLLFWPWAGGECGVVLVLVGTRYKPWWLCPVIGQAPRGVRVHVSQQTDEKSITYARAVEVQCGVPVVRPTPPSVTRSKKFLVTASVTNHWSESQVGET